MRSSAARLTICVPAYRGIRFLPELVMALQAQKFQDFDVLISNDGGSDAAELEAVCAPLGARIHHHKRRLGWVTNCNWMIAQVSTPFFAILPQDDLPDPRFYEALMGQLDANPDASAAFTSIKCKGEGHIDGHIVPAMSHLGGLNDRLGSVLRKDWPGVSFRAVNRMPTNRRALLLTPNPVDNAFVDSTWIFQQAIHGPLLALDEPLYIKRYHDENTHMQWQDGPVDQIERAWMIHCAQMLAFARGNIVDPTTLIQITRLAEERALTPPSLASPWIAEALTRQRKGVPRASTLQLLAKMSDRWLTRLNDIGRI